MHEGAVSWLLVLAMNRTRATVYSETVVHAAPENLAAEAPYQIAIVEFEDGSRRTVRISGERVAIGETVAFEQERDGVAYYSKPL